MTFEKNITDLIFGNPVKIKDNVFVYVPTVEEVVNEDKFEIYTSVLTSVTRQIFATSRQVDEIEKQFPNIWAMLWDEELNIKLGEVFGGENSTLQSVIVDAISYWTKIDASSFSVLQTGKRIVNAEHDWLIDAAEFNKFVSLIKVITRWQMPDDLPPKMTSDIVYDMWMNSFYRNIQEHKKRKFLSWGERILMLSVSMDSYIPIDEIKKMNIFLFYHMSSALDLKDVNRIRWDAHMSPKFESKDTPKHWKEQFKIRLQ